MIQVANILIDTLANGEGMRSVLFLSGCKHDCPGCQNKEAQNFNFGKQMTVEEVYSTLTQDPIFHSVTFSGGDPMYQAKELIPLATKLKSSGYDIWTYTGFTAEEIINSHNTDMIQLFQLSDIVVDGLFDQSLSDNPPRYMGSSNQRIINTKEYLEACNMEDTRTETAKKIENLNYKIKTHLKRAEELRMESLKLNSKTLTKPVQQAI